MIDMEIDDLLPGDKIVLTSCNKDNYFPWIIELKDLIFVVKSVDRFINYYRIYVENNKCNVMNINIYAIEKKYIKIIELVE